MGLGVTATQAEGHPTPHRAVPEVLSLCTSFPSKILIFPAVVCGMGALGTVTLGIPLVSREDVLGETRSRVLFCLKGTGIQQKKLLPSCLLGGK